MDITVNNGENLSLAIKKALIQEGADKECFNASVWNEILDLVDQQNQENKDKGEKELYKGGNIRVPANWKKNYKVFANQILSFSETTWNKIRGVVGLKTQSNIDTKINVKDLSKSPTPFVQTNKEGISLGNINLKNMPEMVQNTNKTTTDTFGFSQKPATKKTSAKPDTVEPRLLKPEAQSKEVPVIPTPEHILDEQKTETNNEEIKNSEQVKKQEQPDIQNNKAKKTKKSKYKSSKPVITINKNSDGTTTEVTTFGNSDGTYVRKEATQRPYKDVTGEEIPNEFTREEITSIYNPDGKIISTKKEDSNSVSNYRRTLTTTYTYNPDGNIVSTKEDDSNSVSNRIETDTTTYTYSPDGNIVGTKKNRSDNISGLKETLTTTYNNNIKTISFDKKNSSKGDINITYSIDDNGNIFTQSADGKKISINTNNLTKHPGYLKYDIKLTDNNGNDITIPLKIDNDCNDYRYTDLYKENQELLLGNIIFVISNLDSKVLNDFKSEVKSLFIDNSILTPKSEIKAAGEYSADRSEYITLYIRNGGLDANVLPHEIGHAVDCDASSRHQSDNYIDKFNKLKNLICNSNISSDIYALKNEKEFFAEYYASRVDNCKNETKTLFEKLENTQDIELKNAYIDIKNTFDKIIEDTRKKESGLRINKDSEKHTQAMQVLSDVLKENKTKIEEILGEKIQNNEDFITLYHREHNSVSISEENAQFLYDIYCKLIDSNPAINL